MSGIHLPSPQGTGLFCSDRATRPHPPWGLHQHQQMLAYIHTSSFFLDVISSSLLLFLL